ncbi:MAG: M15 family metallopeptidase [Candidatus Manganitrophaceae bacterium]
MEKLEGLNPVFKRKVENVIKKMEELGWRIRVVWGKRSQDENDALVKKKVASSKSKHLIGKAVDLIDRRIGYVDDPVHPFYKDLSRTAKEEGLIWGGDFHSRWDPCHIEIP